MKVSFQSTPPVKAATKANDDKIIGDIISIHAAREGGDTFLQNWRMMSIDFNPRRP